MRERIKPWIVIGAVAALALALAPAPAGARCAMRGLVVEVLTPLDRPIPRAAGILIALRPSSGTRAEVAPIGSATVGTPGEAGGTIVLAETLAPGLYRIPLASITPGPHTLRGVVAGELAFTVATAPPAAPPPAPALTSVTVEARGRAGTRATASLARAAPPAAIGLVVHAGGRAIAYAPLAHRSAPSLTAFGRCDRVPDGARSPAQGDSITLRFVDAHGQLSPASPPVVAR